MSITSRRLVVPLALLLSLASACAASGKASVSASSEATEVAPAPELAPKPSKHLAGGGAGGHGNGSGVAVEDTAHASPPEPPRHDPKAVRQAIDRTASPVDELRPRLGLRLGVVEQGPNAPWLLVLVNRGTEPLRLSADLRTLALEVTPPPPPTDPNKPARKPPEPKPVTCALPGELVPKEESASPSITLAPGEGIVDSFDPRLYCLSNKTKSPLVPDASVVVRLGWPERTKTVWRKGKRGSVVLEQSAPFLAQREVPEGSLPEAPAETPPGEKKVEPEFGAAPRSDDNAIKLVLSPAVTLGAEYAPPPPPPADRLDLVLSRGSDARTEAEATVTLSLVNRSKKKERVFFRRELVSFEISGPQGMVACQPGPDARAPDRGAVSTLRPGGRISATSRLIELCPEGSLRLPGLYLVSARFDSIYERDPHAPPAFSGRLVSDQPVAIRVRRGWGELPAQREPERIQIGTP
jgi:hypothetical protein